MSVVQISDLVKIFYKHPYSCLPIINENSGGDIYLVGFLSKQKVLHYSSDKERLNYSFERIPDFLITKEIYPENIWEFFEKSPIPVYSIFAKYKESWNRQEINYYLKNFIFSINYKENLQINENNIHSIEEEKQKRYKLLELILLSIPFPLLSLDIEGNAIFYNELFIKNILERGPFKNTLALAESYFKELIQKIIADYILQNKDIDKMDWEWKEYHYKILILNINEEKELIGYLLVFIPSEILYSSTMQEKDISLTKNNIIEIFKKKLTSGHNYDEIINQLEEEIITEFLKKNNRNITHTAQELKIKRTTLQNKIKKLNLMFNNEEDSIENQKNFTKSKAIKKQNIKNKNN